MGCAERSNEPFFIVGAQRSGTTMLRLMLNSHPRLAVPFETVFIPEFYRRLGEYGDLKDSGNVRHLLDDISKHRFVVKGGLISDKARILAQRIQSYPDLLHSVFSEYAHRQGKLRWGDKSPNYVTEIDVLWDLFPGCRIVHLVRDGRDVAVSLAGLEWGSRSIPRVAQDWRWKTTIAHKMGSLLKGHFLEVRFEDLVQETLETLGRICRFLGEEFHQEMLRYHATAEGQMPASSMKWHGASVQPPDAGKVGLWKRKLSLADRIIFEEVAGDALELFGYPKLNRERTLLTSLKSMYYRLIERW